MVETQRPATTSPAEKEVRGNFDDALFFGPALVVENMAEAIRQFSDVLGFRVPTQGPFSVPKDLDEPGNHKVKFGYIEKNGHYIEFTQPIEGPRKKLLVEQGPGPYLLDFHVKDIAAAFDYFRSKGVELLDPVGNPIVGDKFHQSATGEKVFFFYLAGAYVEVEEAP